MPKVDRLAVTTPIVSGSAPTGFVTVKAEDEHCEVFVDGALIDHALVVAPDTEGCTEPRSASARLELGQTLPADRPALAADSGRLRAHPYPLRSATAAEESVFVSLTRHALVDSGVAVATARRLRSQWTYAIVIPNQRGPVLVGSATVDSTASDGTAWALNAFTIAEGRDRRYEPKLVWHHEGEEADIIALRFLNVVDIDADSVPEIVAESKYYESWAYWLYKRQGSLGWSLLYRGGGGGC